MNKISKLVTAIIFSIMSLHATAFLNAAAQDQHKPALEFKQAVARYIKHADAKSFHTTQRASDENVSYKKEIRYLFKNYGNFSATVLLYRIRSAHQAMVKHDANSDSEAYKRYEQMCSALLLVCTQVFLHDARTQILSALHEIDNLFVYWQYQQNHQFNYFFSKSPVKWVIGKEQHKEIAHNLNKLEHKQRELYTLLGVLTEHAHSFIQVGVDYEECYAWIEQLFENVSCMKISSDYSSDGARFDALAAQLETKIKLVNNFRKECLSSIAITKKPNHFVRNWLAYTTMLAAATYLIHYSSKNPEVIGSIAMRSHDEAEKFLILLIDPLKKIYERGKLIFSDEKKADESKKEIERPASQEQMASEGSQVSMDRKKSLEELTNELVAVAETTDADIAEELAKNLTSLRQDGINSLDDLIGDVKKGYKVVNEEDIRRDMEKIAIKIEAIKKNGVVIGKEKEAKEYEEALDRIYKATDSFFNGVWRTDPELKIQAVLVKYYIKVIDQVLDPIQKYTVIIDKNILRLFQLAAVIIERFTIQTDSLLKFATQQLKDHELTLMFTSLIPLGITCLGASKLYQWITSRDYSLIRIALSDVNGLLIEAADHLDDHDYGKLIYLVCKLKNRARYLKDVMVDEFLTDVAKLESKQYSAQIKRGIVENMFNKYAFLGRIAA